MPWTGHSKHWSRGWDTLAPEAAMPSTERSGGLRSVPVGCHRFGNCLPSCGRNTALLPSAHSRFRAQAGQTCRWGTDPASMRCEDVPGYPCPLAPGCLGRRQSWPGLARRVRILPDSPQELPMKMPVNRTRTPPRTTWTIADVNGVSMYFQRVQAIVNNSTATMPPATTVAVQKSGMR